MFDGNHRSRRQVNLGTTSRRRGRAGQSSVPVNTSLPSLKSSAATGVDTDGRQALLEESRKLREERRRHQLEEKSATKIQNVYRGWEGRKYVANDILEYMWQNRDGSLQRESFLLSLRLARPLLRARKAQSSSASSSNLVQSWLLEHATNIGKFSTQQQQSQPPFGLSYRIVQATLVCLRPLQNTYLSGEQMQSYFLILQFYLRNSPSKHLGGAQGLLELLRTTQECSWWYFSASQGAYQGMVQALWHWSRQGVEELGHDSSLRHSGQALLAAIVMGHHTNIVRDTDLMRITTSNAQDLYEKYFGSLVQVITNQTASNSRIESIFSKVLSQILYGRWHVVLSNALDFQQTKHALPSTALLQYLQFVLTHHKDLAMLTSLVVKGEDVRSVVLLQQQQQLQQKDAADKAQDEDDRALEEEMEEQTEPQQPDSADGTASMTIVDESSRVTIAASNSVKKQKSAATRRLTKQDFQTMPQLERFYQEEMQKQRSQTMSTLLEQVKSNKASAKAYAQSLVEMAVQIGTPSVWISWGNILLKPRASSDMDGSEISSTEAYFQLLSRLLQGSTGLRARTSAGSPFLSQLAFAGNGQMVEQMWQAVVAHAGDENAASTQNRLTCVMLTVFCDVFSHYLIALSDEKFLQQYTQLDSKVGPTPKRLLAGQVIGYLRNLLHEVYWTKPVVASDVKLATTISIISEPDDALGAMRARFLLSGTKLWVSLYERWCRLVRSNPFCDESKWWFPHLASQEGDSAVVHASAARRAANGDANDVVAMEIDSSDEEDDEQMDGSHRTQQQIVTAADAESDALANAFRDPKMARVLTCIPQALPFDRRVRLFDSLVTADKLKTQDENAEMRAAMLQMMQGVENAGFGGRERVEIRRDRLYDDSMHQLNKLGSRLKRKVQVSFVNQHGMQEAGIDGGGVFKEFVDDLIKDAFSVDASDNYDSSDIPRLFSVTPLQTLTVNSQVTQDHSLLPHYEFLGRVLGKAVYESILVEPQFCLPFLNQLLGKRNSLEDLQNFDMEYYKNLTKLLDLTESEINELGLTFELTLGEGPAMRTVELLPGGRSKPVTKQDVIQYVHLVSHQRLNVEGAAQTRAFLNGFRDLIPASWVRLFSAYELQKLISGDDSLRGFDVASLKRSMKYAAGYHPSQPIMHWFWEVLEEFTPEQQRKFLKFMTSCSRQPLLGFSSLDPPPCVQQIRLPDNVFNEGNLATAIKNSPLPTSSTCMNLLKLPNYGNKELLRKKLLDAVESGAGFELT